MNTTPNENRRHHERSTLPPMLTSISVQYIQGRADDEGFMLKRCDGHAYDLSISGARIEIDEPLEQGQMIAVSLTLPEGWGDVFTSARVVWVNDQDDDPGPRRMAIEFTDFLATQDRDILKKFLRLGTIRQAA